MGKDTFLIHRRRYVTKMVFRQRKRGNYLRNESIKVTRRDIKVLQRDTKELANFLTDVGKYLSGNLH